ncbi:MAG: DHA2 family efflux MFS transporter permease subunit [Acetobacteraceae bacterium]|nr:DHA2 family efflux MFS transporter permease subunit [Pseudomonadota bacterium]
MSGAAAAAGAEAAPSLVRIWVTVIGAAIGAFMAVLNILIVNASLSDIQGAIGAGTDDGAWISTAYLVAEIVVIPLTGWLAQVFSMRRYLLTNAVLFLVFSIACAYAQNIEQMIVLRAIQGFAGGVLIPAAFTIIITTLPRAQLPMGLALFSLSATFAPAIGPTIGGYLTELFSWKAVFYLNLAPGLVMVGMLWATLPSTPMRLSLLRTGDWLGIATMAVGLGCLQTVLEEGNKEDWFGSPFIVKLSIIAAVSLTAFIIIELVVERPLLNLRLVKRRNFGFGLLANTLLGITLFGSSYIMPLYLARVQGYNSLQIGWVLAWMGLPQLLLIPLVPRLMQLIDTKVLCATGLMLFAISNFMNIWLTSNVGADQLLIPNLVRALGQALLFSPLSALATAGIEAAQAGSASALFNMMRNLGGAFGIATLQTFLTVREQYHSNILTHSVSVFSEATRQRIDALTQYFIAHGVSDPAVAAHKAIIAIGMKVKQQALIMGFSDTFFVMGASLALSAAAAAMLKTPEHMRRRKRASP